MVQTLMTATTASQTNDEYVCLRSNIGRVAPTKAFKVGCPVIYSAPHVRWSGTFAVRPLLLFLLLLLSTFHAE